MNKTRKLWVLSIVLTAVLSGTMTYALTRQDIRIHQNPRSSGNVLVFHEGHTISQYLPTSDGNLVTDLYEHYLRDLQGFDNVTDRNVTQWISLSNDATPLVTWTELPGEVTNSSRFGRAQGTVTAWMNGTDHAYNVTFTFRANDTQQLQCAGSQFNGTVQSNNNLAAAATFEQTTFQAGENLTITWVWTYDGN